jgi:aspartokinase
LRTIASEVLDYIHRKPFLLSALSQGIINLTSLARQIQPEIEVALKKPAKSGAIVMALKRISENEEFLGTHKIVKILKNIGEITVRSSIVDYCFRFSNALLDTQAQFLNHIKDKTNVFYTSSQGVAESTIIVSKNLSEELEAFFKKEECLSKEANLSAISLKLPTENVKISGLYYFIFQRLSWEGVNIHEVISTANEFTILTDETSVNTAFKVIKELKSL